MNSSSYTQWCNANEARKYPFDDTALLTTGFGEVLPDDILVDACLVLPPQYANAYCSSIRLTPNLLSIVFVHDNAPLLVGTFARSQYTPYTAVALTPLIANVSGWVVFGSHAVGAPEQYIFTSASQSGLARRAVRIIRPPPVTYMTGLGLETQVKMTRLVKLAGSAVLRIYQDPSNAQKIIFELDAAQGPNFRSLCAQAADAAHQVPVVTTISGVPADSNGVITLRLVGDQ